MKRNEVAAGTLAYTARRLIEVIVDQTRCGIIPDDMVAWQALYRYEIRPSSLSNTYNSIFRELEGVQALLEDIKIYGLLHPMSLSTAEEAVLIGCSDMIQDTCLWSVSVNRSFSVLKAE